ncbi:General transcription factor IIF subunit 1 [Gryllus bimaculatus]|nr:General transcription factor IIF subunit 1 [Gryllus bimaculatus]
MQVNYFSLMMRKRLRGEKEEDLDDGEEHKVKGKSKARKGDLKISEMEDWIESSESSESDEENNKEKEEEKPKKKKKAPPKKKKKHDPDDEAFEESDDGDEEGREVDYISDSSESGSDHETKVTKELKGVEEEDALRKLLSSGEEEEEEEQKRGRGEGEESEDTKGNMPNLLKDEKDKKSRKKIRMRKKKDGQNKCWQVSRSGRPPTKESPLLLAAAVDSPEKRKAAAPDPTAERRVVWIILATAVVSLFPGSRIWNYRRCCPKVSYA